VGVKAVAITDAVQVVVPPRWSDTVTTPSKPLIVLERVDATCDPSDTLPVGALIESVPAVRVKLAVVVALAGGAAAVAVAASTAAAVLASSRNFRISCGPFSVDNSGRPPIGVIGRSDERHKQ
jgi:hypothetical protein